MEDINKGARPVVAPYFVIEAVDFKVTDPAAADPNAPVRMLWVNQPFTLHLIIKLTGQWRDHFNGKIDPDDKWMTKYYADSLGVDVGGERHWGPEEKFLPDPIFSDANTDVYDIAFTVQQGLSYDGLYEFGAYTRLPREGINAWVEGYHVEVALP